MAADGPRLSLPCDEVQNLVEAFHTMSPRTVIGALGPDVVPHVVERSLSDENDSTTKEVRARDDSGWFWSLTRDDWASDVLGLAIGKVELFLTYADTDAERLAISSAGFDSLRRAAVGDDLDLVVLRLIADDTISNEAAERAGFRVVEYEHKYMANNDPTFQPRVSDHAAIMRSGVDVSVHEGGERLPVTDEECEKLALAARAYQLSHFAFDDRVTGDAIAAFYAGWTSNTVEGRYGDRVAVARIRDEVVGIYCFARSDDVPDDLDATLFNAGWAVVSLQGRGALSAMFDEMMSKAPDAPTRWFEVETSARNNISSRASAHYSLDPTPLLCTTLHLQLL